MTTKNRMITAIKELKDVEVREHAIGGEFYYSLLLPNENHKNLKLYLHAEEMGYWIETCHTKNNGTEIFLCSNVPFKVPEEIA